MVRLILIFVGYLAFLPSAHAEYTGWAFLAAEHKQFPPTVCKALGEAGPNPVIAALADSFGNTNKCIRQFGRAAKGKPHMWMYYMSNEVSRRKTMSPKDFLSGVSINDYNQNLCKGDRITIRAVKRKAKALLKRCRRYINGECKIAIGLESQFTECATKRLVQAVSSSGWQAKDIIHNPVHMSPYRGYGGAGHIEHHGTGVCSERNCIVSLDGTCPDFEGRCTITGDRVSDAAVSSWHSKNKARGNTVLLWAASMQGLNSDSGQAPFPHKRHIKFDKSAFNRGNSLVGIVGGSQSQQPGKHNLKRCTVVRDFGSGNIAKDSDHGGFVAVMMPKLKRAQLVAPGGKRFRLRYTGTANPFQGKPRHHYRHRKRFSQFPDNMVLRGKVGRKMNCFKLYRSGSRHG